MELLVATTASMFQTRGIVSEKKARLLSYAGHGVMGVSIPLFLLAGLLGGPAQAQPAANQVPRVGWLVTGDAHSYRHSLAAFREGLRALNYVEGKNVVIEYRWAEGKVERLPQLAKELVQLKVNVIVAGGGNGARAALGATRTIPIVNAGTGDLVSLGLVASLARPGGNLTGFPVASPETAAKQIEIMKEILPRSQRAAVFWYGAGHPFSELQRKHAEDAAAALGVALTWYAADTLPDLDAAFERVEKSRADFLVVFSTPFFFTYRKRIADFAVQRRLPSAYTLSEFVDDRGFLSYGANIPETYRRAAGYVDKILKGAKAGDLPVELPSTFELVINMKTAKALGIALPQSVLLRASRVIE